MGIYGIFKSLAFRIDAELAHRLSLRLLSLSPARLAGLFCPPVQDSRLALSLGKLRWTFPVGLAAGLDKDAVALEFFSRIGFGALEAGTVTRMPQAGNPRPRLFRLEREQSLLNRMGFNSAGAQRVLENLQKFRGEGKVVGVNLGINQGTPEDQVAREYCLLQERFAKVADYLVINVSSPNTRGLREYQKGDKIRSLLSALSRESTGTPMYLKISPDLEDRELAALAELAKEFALAGIVAVNTTAIHDRGEGGLSGRLLRERAWRVRQSLLDLLRETPDIHVIGVGGIENFPDLLQFWRSGGRAVQVYSAFIYQGPDLIKRFYRDIKNFLQQTGASNVDDLLANIDQV